MTLQTIAALAQHESGNGTASPTQQVLPGTHAPFDVAAALDSIEEHEIAASQAERRYTTAADHAKEYRKAADAANTKLRDLIRALNEQRHAQRYESRSADGDAPVSRSIPADSAVEPRATEAGSEPADSHSEIDSPAPPEDPSLLGESDAPTSEVTTDSAAAAVDVLPVAQIGHPRGVKARGRRREQ